MSAEVLRRAASLMCERADVYHEGTWRIVPGPAGHKEIRHEFRDDDGEWIDGFVLDIDTTSTAEHIASWHPEVALAVADWLGVVAARNEALLSSFAAGSRAGAVTAAENTLGMTEALAVARAYLGSDA